MSTADLFPAAEFTGVSVGERNKWLAIRRTMVTASKTAALFGEHPFATALDLYVDMITERPIDELVPIESPMFWGTALESAIFQSAATYYGWTFAPGGQMLRSRKYAHLGATLDGAIDFGDGWKVYEGKTTSAWRARDWDEQTGAVPTHVIIQAQHQMLVTGSDQALVFCLIGGQKPVKVMLEANEEFHRAIVEETERFMEMVRELRPPTPDGKPGATRALHNLYPTENGQAVALPAEAVDWTREYQNIATQLRALERRKEYFAQLLKHSIGEATFGVLPEPVGGKRIWRWATQPRPAYTVEASTSRVLLALKDRAFTAAVLPEAENDTLVAALTKSIDETEHGDVAAAAPIRLAQGRRRSRR